MTELDALVSMAQTALRFRGQWHVEGVDAVLRRDIRAMVGDCAKLLRLSPDNSIDVERAAVRELERRATNTVGPGGSVKCPHCHWGFAPSVIDQHVREKHRSAS